MTDQITVVLDEGLKESLIRNGWTPPSDKPKEWYDDIPEQGVLCWCYSGSKENKRLDIITCMNRYLFVGDINEWAEAIPLTHQEVEKLVYKEGV